MKTRHLGHSGLKVSEIGLGCNNFGARIDQAQTQAVVDKALDLGINFFDTADVYGNTQSEVLLGKALGARRKEVVVATKFGLSAWPGEHKKGASRRWIMEAVEDSLARLGTDYIDLYQLHAPDPSTPLEETLAALDALVRQGKVRYIGCSNFAGWQIADAHWIARELGTSRFISAQNLYSLLERDVEREVIPACEHFGLGLLPYFPLASGLLTGKYRRGEAVPENSRFAAWKGLGDKTLNDKNFARVEALGDWASERGHPLLELAFGWLLSQPAVASVIAGATGPDQVEANVAASGWRLNREELKEIAAL